MGPLPIVNVVTWPILVHRLTGGSWRDWSVEEEGEGPLAYTFPLSPLLQPLPLFSGHSVSHKFGKLVRSCGRRM